jgi:hypothetical protein
LKLNLSLTPKSLCLWIRPILKLSINAHRSYLKFETNGKSYKEWFLFGKS